MILAYVTIPLEHIPLGEINTRPFMVIYESANRIFCSCFINLIGKQYAVVQEVDRYLLGRKFLAINTHDSLKGKGIPCRDRAKTYGEFLNCCLLCFVCIEYFFTLYLSAIRCTPLIKTLHSQNSSLLILPHKVNKTVFGGMITSYSLTDGLRY